MTMVFGEAFFVSNCFNVCHIKKYPTSNYTHCYGKRKFFQLKKKLESYQIENPCNMDENNFRLFKVILFYLKNKIIICFYRLYHIVYENSYWFLF